MAVTKIPQTRQTFVAPNLPRPSSNLLKLTTDFRMLKDRFEIEQLEYDQDILGKRKVFADLSQSLSNMEYKVAFLQNQMLLAVGTTLHTSLFDVKSAYQEWSK